METLQVDWFDENGTLTNDSWPEGTVRKITDKDGKEPADGEKLDEGNAYLVYKSSDATDTAKVSELELSSKNRSARAGFGRTGGSISVCTCEKRTVYCPVHKS